MGKWSLIHIGTPGGPWQAPIGPTGIASRLIKKVMKQTSRKS